MMQRKLWGATAALVAGLAALQSAQAHPTAVQVRRPTVTVHKRVLLACNMAAMTPAQKLRHDQIAEQLRSATRQVIKLPDGFAFRYASDPALFRAAAEFITLESQCCSFYQFRLEQDPEKGPMWLFVTGPQNGLAFIKSLLAP